MNYWLAKSEPDVYSFDTLIEEKIGTWDGVRNYQARNNLKSMKIGDQVLFYHSNIGLEVVGIAEVVKEHFQDPSTDDDRWVAIQLKPIKKLNKSVTLKTIKATPTLGNIPLIKHSRLSVMPLLQEEFEIILHLAEEEGYDG